MRLKLFFPILLAAVIITLGYVAWVTMHNPNAFPFRHVKVISNYTYVQPQRLQRIINSHIEGGFFSLRLAHLKKAVTALPWVAGVSIRRIWPSTLLIRIEEQQPLVRWNKDGVFNHEGKLFFPARGSIPPKLPSILAPEDQREKSFKYFQEINAKLSKINLTLSHLSLNNRGSFSLVLSNGLPVIVGRQAVMTRIERFISVYPKIIGEKAGLIDRIDLRYASGLAIKWRN